MIPEHASRSNPPLFATTRWSVVIAAKGQDSGAALETLCRTYWVPLYAYVRSSGHSQHDAQDLTQEFFSRLLVGNFLRAVEREKGRFRTFLRMAMKRFLANEWDRARAQKRGGGQAPVVFDTASGEEAYLREPAPAPSPDALYEKRWALTLLDDAFVRLESESIAAGGADTFQSLRSHLTADRGTIPYAELAAAMGTTESAARVALHRLRKRFREVFRETISDTVSSPDEVDDEVRHVIAVLGGK